MPDVEKLSRLNARKIELLEGQIKGLRSAVGELGTFDGDLLELLKIIHRPGWTTVAESIFATGVLEGMLTQVQVLAGLRQTLLSASNAVGQRE